MNLTEHYNQLYKASSATILAGNYDLDFKINDISDSRLGLTLLLRPSEKVKAHIQLFLKELKLEDALLANAFIIRDIPYYWKKGRIEKWKT